MLDAAWPIGLVTLDVLRLRAPKTVEVVAMSRYEVGLLDRISVQSDLSSRWILILRLAAYRAKKGEISMARQEIAKIRSSAAALGNAQLLAHINFAEAICEFFEFGAEAGLVKIRRSQALCAGCPEGDDLPGLVAAWGASFYRILENWDGLNESFSRLVEARYFHSGEVRCRLSLTIADCLQELRNYSLADKWYEVARHESLLLGDETVLGAVLYNKSAIRVFNVRIDETRGEHTDLIKCDFALQAASAENLAHYTRDTAMPWVFDMLAGQLMLLRGDFEGALLRLDSTAAQGLSDKWPAVDLIRRSDLLRARSKLGLIRRDQTVVEAQKFEMYFERGKCSGDSAVAAFSLSEAVREIDNSLYAKFRDISSISLEDYQEEKAKEQLAVDQALSGIVLE